MTISNPTRLFNLLHMLFISATVLLESSSKYNFVFNIEFIELLNLSQSYLSIFLSDNLFAGVKLFPSNILCIICLFGISKLKKATVLLFNIRFSVILIDRAVFPIEGRPANRM